MAHVSERLHIKWGTAKADEDTSTLVVTTAERRYVDIRIITKLPSGLPFASLPNDGGPLSRLEWAFAGTSTSTPLDPAHPSNKFCTWHHWVDSKFDIGDEIPVDQGQMCPTANPNIAFEYGEMVNPRTGVLTKYEEKWQDLDIETVGDEGMKICAAITIDRPEDKIRGAVVRVGQYCQGILKIGNEITVERWQYISKPSAEQSEAEQLSQLMREVPREAQDGDWTRIARIGSRFLPCSMTFRTELLAKGATLNHGELAWTVQEVHTWDG